MADEVATPAEPASHSEIASSEAHPPSTAAGVPPNDEQSRMTRMTHHSHAADGGLKNKQHDFFYCTGILLIIAIVCAIAIVCIHFIVLTREKDGIFCGDNKSGFNAIQQYPNTTKRSGKFVKEADIVANISGLNGSIPLPNMPVYGGYGS